MSDDRWAALIQESNGGHRPAPPRPAPPPPRRADVNDMMDDLAIRTVSIYYLFLCYGDTS